MFSLSKKASSVVCCGFRRFWFKLLPCFDVFSVRCDAGFQRTYIMYILQKIRIVLKVSRFCHQHPVYNTLFNSATVLVYRGFIL
jgi:hypothetical protein